MSGIFYSDVIPTTPDWLWKGFILSSDANMWIAEGGAAKGHLSIDVAARISRGWPMPPHDPHDPNLDPELFTTPGYVILIRPEDNPSHTTVHQLKAAGADLSKIYDMTKVVRRKVGGNTMRSRFSLPQDLPLLRAKIRELGDVRLVIIDPMLAVATKTVSFNQQVRMNIIDPVQDMMAEEGPAALFVNHFTKGVTVDNMIDRTFGSKGITQALRCNSVILCDEFSDVRTLMSLKCNLLPEGSIEPVEYIVTGESPASYVRYKMPAPAIESRDQIQANILAALIDAARPMSSQEMASYVRLSHELVKQLLDDARNKGLVERRRGAYTMKAILAPDDTQPIPAQE